MKIGDKFIFPKASDFKLLQDYYDHMENSIKECDKRGYHKVMQDNEDSLICYDCNTPFEKKKGIKYKVEDPFNP